MRPTVAAIIPVFDEEAAIGQVIRAIPRDLVDEVIVVDGGSRDATARIAAEAGARVVVERRRGYGRACATGASATRCNVVVFLDGDGSDDSSALGRVLDPVLADQADLALGTRIDMEVGALPWYARAGNLVAARIISLLWRQRVEDLPSCKAIRRRHLLALQMTEDTYGWTIEMIVKSARRRLRIREVSLTYRRRVGGESKVSGNPRASLLAAVSILRVLARHAFARGDDRHTSRPLLLPVVDRSTGGGTE